MILLLGFAFISGFFTILAPCIWPLLPIILSTSINRDGGHGRPLGITLGIMVSFAAFTLTISYIVSLFHINPDIFRIIGACVIAVLGLALIIPKFNLLLETAVSKLTGRVRPTGTPVSGGFGSGFITGLSLGLVWSPCAGPILATIATLAATQAVTFQVVLVTVAYVFGMGIPLFIFAYAGRKVVHKSRSISPYTGRLQQAIGVIMIITAVLMYTNKIQDFQIAILDRLPILNTLVNGFETSDAVKNQLNQLKGGAESLFTAGDSSELFNASVPAPEITGITQWLNNPSGAGVESNPVTLAQLKGKVVLIDFWTYTCINCVRTLPHITSWYDKYKDNGFVVIGVHTPEFAFEKETANVQAAINKFAIHYPVALDNDYGTWNAFTNQYWPAEYLIDAKGIVRRTHFGEGEYDQMELAIQTLLKEAGQTVTAKIQSMPDETPVTEISPETYVGSKRMQYLFPQGKVDEGEQSFTMPIAIPVNNFAFGGTWNIMSEYAETKKNSSLTYTFSAGHVYLVIKKGTSTNGKVAVLLDGKPIDQSVSGKDVSNGTMMVDGDRLYDIVDLHGKTEQHTLQLQFLTPGLQVFAYTFG